MVVVRVNKTLFTCVAADTKPTTGIIGSALALETDTGKFFWTIDSGTTWTAASTAVASLIGSIILTSQVTGTLPVANGGTGAATLTGVLKGNGTGAVTAATPLPVADGGTGAATLTGVLKGAGTGAITAAALLAVADGGTGAGTLTGILKGNGTSAFTALTDPLPIANGGTSGATATAGFDALSGLTTLGDLLYGGASGTRTRLAGNLTASKKFFSQTGTGAASAAPAWAVDPYFPSSGRKTGRIIPTVNGATAGIYGDGLLNSPITIAGTVSFLLSTVADGGNWSCITSGTTGGTAGFRITANLYMRGLNPRFKVRFKMDSLTAVKSFIGFRVSGSVPSTDDPANASSCAMFGFSSTISATNWIIWTNNGTTTTETTDTTIAADTSYHTIEIVANDAGSKFTYSLDEAAPVDMISTIPAQTTLLTVNFSNVTTENVLKTLTMTWMEVEQDK